MKKLAAEKRAEHKVQTSCFGLREIRRIYKLEGIKIDKWKVSHRIRAIYMCEDGDCSVLMSTVLPPEPRLFALAHELKHHYRDRKDLGEGKFLCGEFNANQMVEIGAEVFAAEFIYPEEEFLGFLPQIGVTSNTCSPEHVVDLKRNCGAKVSYTFLIKRLEWFRYIQPGQFRDVKFQKLEEQVHGPPIYKQDWFKEHRKRRSKKV